MIIFDKIDYYLHRNLPFVAFKKPNEKVLNGFFQKNDNLYCAIDFCEEGFIFAPFEGHEVILIPENQSEVIVENFDLKLDFQHNDDSYLASNHSKRKHINLVRSGINAIKDGHFQKVVLSRKEVIDLKNFDLIAVFQKLLCHYPSAFAYCFYHPKVGLWLGGFSEQLLKIEGKHFSTMALAGTQKWNENEILIWEDKEIKEQQFVSDFITGALNNKVSNLKVALPCTIKAGTLAHIQTAISGILNDTTSLKELLQILHPTPAVCGFPKEYAKNFILDNENYDREFYAGYLGLLNIKEKTDLFVNLRCMKIEKQSANLYVGGGITISSNPEKEWEETVNKAQTIKNILKPY